jgi:hypothetical protein
MSTSATDAITKALPLKIRAIEYNNPFLGLIGESWTLTLMCPWTITEPNRTYTWDSNEVEDLAWDLVGHEIESVEFARTVTKDPTFIISGNVRLAIRADDGWEPWTMRVPGLTVIGEMPS